MTSGDINGIGLEIIEKTIQREEFRGVEFTLFGPGKYVEELKSDNISTVDCGPDDVVREYGKPSVKTGESAFRAVKAAVFAALKGDFDALVTAPLTKHTVNLAGHEYTGHTQMLQQWCGVKDNIMIFLSGWLKVGLITVHIPLAEVSSKLSKNVVKSKVELLNDELIGRFNEVEPKIALCSLNPHSGESGMFGHEEVEIMMPAVEELRSEGIKVTDPLPADTLFLNADKYSAVLAVYHDQGLIPAKLSPGGSTNYTGGLPIIRTSPDHGTAMNIAGKGLADSRGMINAVKWAVKLCR